jgi:hypothetical protein
MGLPPPINIYSFDVNLVEYTGRRALLDSELEMELHFYGNSFHSPDTVVVMDFSAQS